MLSFVKSCVHNTVVVREVYSFEALDFFTLPNIISAITILDIQNYIVNTVIILTIQ